jgi:hypothetical protein
MACKWLNYWGRIFKIFVNGPRRFGATGDEKFQIQANHRALASVFYSLAAVLFEGSSKGNVRISV